MEYNAITLKLKELPTIFFEVSDKYFEGETTLNQILQGIVSPHGNLEAIRQYRGICRKRVMQGKRDWMLAEYANYDRLSPNSALLQEKKYIETVKDFSFPITSPSGVVQRRKAQLEEWCSADPIKCPMVSYFYLAYKDKDAILCALEKDIEYYLVEHFCQTSTESGSDIIVHPTDFLQFPIFSLKNSKVEWREHNGVLYSDYESRVGEETKVVRYIVKKPKSAQAQALDRVDAYITDYILTAARSDLLNLVNRRNAVKLSLRGLVLHAYSHVKRPSRYHYMDIKARIEKLLNFQVMGFTKPEDGKTLDPGNFDYLFNFFDSVEYYKEGQKEYCSLRIGAYLLDQLLEKQVMRISNQDYLMIELDEAKYIYNYIQRARIDAYIAGTILQPTYFVYSDLTRLLRLRPSNRKKNLVLIEKCLQEFLDKELLITDYSLEKDFSFKLIFKPLSEEEQYLLSNQDFFSMPVEPPL